jgi:hypothetical protein
MSLPFDVPENLRRRNYRDDLTSIIGYLIDLGLLKNLTVKPCYNSTGSPQKINSEPISE